MTCMISDKVLSFYSRVKHRQDPKLGWRRPSRVIACLIFSMCTVPSLAMPVKYAVFDLPTLLGAESTNRDVTQEKPAHEIPSPQPSPQIGPVKTLRLLLPNLDNTPETVNEIVRRIHNAMMAEFNIAITPVNTPWIRRNVMMERGEGDLTVKSHATHYEKIDPSIVRVDVPVIRLDDIKITYNELSDEQIENVGVLRGTLNQDTYCEEYHCFLANSEDHLMSLLKQRRVESIVVLEILLAAQLEKLKGLNLRYENVFTHNVHVYFAREHAKYKEGLERQFSQYWE